MGFSHLGFKNCLESFLLNETLKKDLANLFTTFPAGQVILSVSLYKMQHV